MTKSRSPSPSPSPSRRSSSPKSKSPKSRSPSRSRRDDEMTASELRARSHENKVRRLLADYPGWTRRDAEAYLAAPARLEGDMYTYQRLNAAARRR